MNLRQIPAVLVASTVCAAVQAQSEPVPLSLTIPSVAVPASALPPVAGLVPELSALPVPSLPQIAVPAQLPSAPELAELAELPSLPLQMGVSRATVNLSSLGLPSPLETLDRFSPIEMNLSDVTTVGPVTVPRF